ncbi:MAG: hypothetical protein VXW45_09095 [Pseudomonadota bacterium]|jgi:hypothetical protein|nr:hypothetical protein [Gammaproteobacteria bacterium]MEC7188589.1 hypothetical protein [Pseudomonadota bacterium]
MNQNVVTILALRPSFVSLTLGLFLSTCSTEDVEWVEVPLGEDVFFQEELKFRSDTIEIPLFAGADLEYKLGMKLGNAVSYNWQAANLELPDDLLIEFHGHTIRESDAPGDVMFYKRHRTDSASGYLVAPFDGIHGWYFDNQSNGDIVITLNVSGFYELQ